MSRSLVGGRTCLCAFRLDLVPLDCRYVGGGRAELALVVDAIAADGEKNAQGPRFVEFVSGDDAYIGGLSV
jgi:hypothetical protein